MGAIIGQQTGCDKEDPHAHLSGGAFPRCALLENPDPNPNPSPNPNPNPSPNPNQVRAARERTAPGDSHDAARAAGRSAGPGG